MREQLIAAIENDPDDVESYRVYADWLEANNQPGGQLITMELLRERLTDRAKREHLTRRIAEYVQRNRGTFFGALKSWPELRYETTYGPLRWRYGFIHTAQLARTYDRGDAVERLRELLASPSGRFLVVIQLETDPAQALLELLVEKVPASLRRFEVAYDGVDLSAAWPALARLAHLGVRRRDTVLGTVDLPRLETLAAHCAHLPALFTARLPKLETLRIEYCDDPRGLLRLLDTLDAPVNRIELESSQHTGELVEELSSTRIGGQLAEIDLSYGQLTDAGARRWAKNPPAQRLRKVVVRHNSLTRHGIRMLEEHVAVEVIARQEDEA